MRLELIEELNKYGYPVMLQGTLPADKPYPDSFITFWQRPTEPVFYDDGIVGKKYNFAIYFYSNDPLLVLAMIEKIADDLRQKNYHVGGEEDAPSDEPSHTGQLFDCYYIKSF